jgi:hypothetical protein
LWSILIETVGADIDILLADLADQGTVGVLEEPFGLRAFFEDVADRSAVLSAFPGRIREIAQALSPPPPVLSDWEPFPVGDRFWVAPPGGPPPPSGRFLLEIEPSLAFGTGRHESTQLCLRALEQLFRPGLTVLDVGCGSGILSAAALALGARQVFACDIDSLAVREANVRWNIPAFVGSAAALAPGSGDLVFANISARVVDRIAADLQRIARPDALIVLAGFLSAQPPARFRPERIETLGEWELWVVRPECVRPAPELDLPESPEQAAQWWIA